MWLESILDLISCWPFLLCFPINRAYVLGISLLIWSHADCFSCDFRLTERMYLESFTDLISRWPFLLCVFLLTARTCWEYIIDLISCWPFPLCFPINRVYVLGISLLIWSHADCFSCVFLLTGCKYLETITDLISCWLFLFRFPVHKGVRAWNFVIDLISCWLFLFCFPINRLYVFWIPLLIWSHAGLFSYVFLLTVGTCLECHCWFDLMLTVSLVFSY